MNVHALDSEGSSDPFVVVHGGRQFELPSPCGIASREVVALTDDENSFGKLMVPALHIPKWKLARLASAYREHYGLPSGQAQRLVWLLSRYGQPIERDLAYRGIDLTECWRSRRWRRLLNLIDGLPSHSAYQEAMALDEELAEEYADDDRPREDYRPRITEWSPTEQLLAALYDRMGEVVAATVASAGGKPTVPPGWPRPETAADKVLRRRQKREYDDLMDLVEQSKRRTTA